MLKVAVLPPLPLYFYRCKAYILFFTDEGTLLSKRLVLLHCFCIIIVCEKN